MREEARSEEMTDREVRLKIEDIRWAMHVQESRREADYGELAIYSLRAKVAMWPEEVGSVDVLEGLRDHLVRLIDRKLSWWACCLSWRRKQKVWPILRPVAWAWSRPIEIMLQRAGRWVLRRWPVRFRRYHAHAVAGDLTRLNLPPQLGEPFAAFVYQPERGIYGPNHEEES